MKRSALLLLLLSASACTGIVAREEVLMPSMSLAWSPTISTQIEHDVSDRLGLGVIDAEQAKVILDESDAMLAALQSGERGRVIEVDWSMLRMSGLAGIQHRLDAEEIGPITAGSFIETVFQFNESWVLLLSR